MSFAAHPLKIIGRITSEYTTMQVVGEVDIATAPEFRRELARLLSHRPPELRVDLSGVSFMDSSGLHALLDASRTAQRQGGKFVLVGTSPQVDRLMSIAGVSWPAAGSAATG
jgi:anti-anti-sigma factor